MNKSILVLGATSDIGQATAKVFAARGYNLLLASREVNKLFGIKYEWQKKFGVDIKTYQFDARDRDNHLSFCTLLPDKIDIVLVAFGVNGDPILAKEGRVETDLVMHTNFISVVSVLHALQKTKRINSGGSIIVLSSIAGERGKKFNYLYGASKAALSFYLDGLRADLFSKKIHVMTVKPGYIRTKMLPQDDSPKWLTSDCNTVALDIYSSYLKKRQIVYTPWYWRYLILIIKLVPESLLKRMNF